jgi:hypothetical protein
VELRPERIAFQSVIEDYTCGVLAQCRANSNNRCPDLSLAPEIHVWKTGSWLRPPRPQKVGDLVLPWTAAPSAPSLQSPTWGGPRLIPITGSPHGVHQQIGIGPPQKHVQTGAVPHCPRGRDPHPRLHHLPSGRGSWSPTGGSPQSPGSAPVYHSADRVLTPPPVRSTAPQPLLPLPESPSLRPRTALPPHPPPPG